MIINASALSNPTVEPLNFARASMASIDLESGKERIWLLKHFMASNLSIIWSVILINFVGMNASSAKGGAHSVSDKVS